MYWPAPVAAGAIADQSFVDGAGNQTVDVSGDFTFSGVPAYSVQTGPAGVSVDGSGVVTFDDSQLGVQTATPIVIRQADQSNASRFADTAFNLTITDVETPPVLDGASITGTEPSLDLTVTFEAGTTSGRGVRIWVYVDDPADADPDAATIVAGTGANATANATTTAGATGVSMTLTGSATGTQDVFIVAEFTDNTPGVYSNIVSVTGIDFGSSAVWNITDNGDGTFAVNSIPPVPGRLQLTDNGDGTFAAEVV